MQFHLAEQIYSFDQKEFFFHKLQLNTFPFRYIQILVSIKKKTANYTKKLKNFKV